MSGCPIFRRERHAPESRAGNRKLQTNLGLTRSNRSQEDNVALLFFLGRIVLQENFTSARDSRGDHNQRAMRIYGQRCRLFLEGFSLGIGSAEVNGNLHQDSLTAAAWTWMRRSTCGLTHNPSTTEYTPGLGKVECQARACTQKRYAAVSRIGITWWRSNRLGKRKNDGTDFPFRSGRRMLRRAGRSVNSCVYRVPGRFGAAVLFFVRDPAVILPTARASRTCAESRTAPGTSSLGSPSIGR